MSTLVFYSEFDSFEEWSALLAPRLPGVTICRAETVQNPDEVHYALAWKPPHGFFAPYRHLKLLVNLGAGSIHWWGATICRRFRLFVSPILIWRA